MIVNEVAVVGEIEIPNVEVDDEFTLEVRVRVFSIERDEVDVSSASGYASLPGGLHLKAVAVQGWPTPAEPPPAIPPDYADSAE